MTNAQREYVKRFVNDESMSKAVEEVMLDYFLAPSGTSDVQMLAVERLLLNKIPKVFAYLRNSIKETEEKGSVTNIGL